MAREVKFLGHIVDEQGLRPDPDKVAVVKDWPVPTCLKELRSFWLCATTSGSLSEGMHMWCSQ
jgi:hypothetical protein